MRTNVGQRLVNTVTSARALTRDPTPCTAEREEGGMLAKLYRRRFRCAACGRLFELPLDDVTLPTHARDRAGREVCVGGDAVPA